MGTSFMLSYDVITVKTPGKIYFGNKEAHPVIYLM